MIFFHRSSWLTLPAAYSSELSAALRIIEIDHDSLSLNSKFKKASRSLLFHLLKVVLGHEQRLANTDATLLPAGYIEALGPQVYWTVNLYITRFLYVFAPYEVIHSAEALVKEMHKDVLTTRILSPIDIYSLSLAVITLLEASKLPHCAEFCWKILGDVEQILDRRAQATANAGEFEDIFSTPQWDQQLRAWIAAEKSGHSLNKENTSTEETENQSSTNNINPATNNANNNTVSSSQPPLGLNEQRSLQHLADLAVGAEGTATNEDGSAPPAPSTSASGSAAAAAAAGTANNNAMDISNEAGSGTGPGNGTAQQGQTAAPTTTGLGGAVMVNFGSALRRGFMNILSMPPGSRH